MEGDSNPNKDFRHRLIQEEFRNILTSSEYKIPFDTEGVVALSGPPVKDVSGNVIDEASLENRERIGFSVEVIKQIVSKKSGKDISSLTGRDFFYFGPMLVLNGETEQLKAMKEIAQGFDFPEEKIELVDCGKRGTANTKTQFEVMNNDPRYSHRKHLTFVTNDWHAPRVIRTADKNLRPEIHFNVLPVPHDRATYNIFRVVRGEVGRIEKYSNTGDITRSVLPQQK